MTVEQSTRGLMIQRVLAEAALSWLHVSKIWSPSQAVNNPLISDGEDSNVFRGSPPCHMHYKNKRIYTMLVHINFKLSVLKYLVLSLVVQEFSEVIPILFDTY